MALVKGCFHKQTFGEGNHNLRFTEIIPLTLPFSWFISFCQKRACRIGELEAI